VEAFSLYVLYLFYWHPGYLNYTLIQSTTLLTLVADHTMQQAAALAELKAQAPDGNSSALPKFNAVLVKTRMDAGLGNQVPSIMTGYLLALLTRRIFLLASHLTQYVHIPLAGAWGDFKSHYNLINVRAQAVGAVWEVPQRFPSVLPFLYRL